MNEVILIYVTAFALAWPLGLYMAKAFAVTPNGLDRVFGPVERLLYKTGGIDAQAQMDWRDYGKALLKLHLVLGVLVFVIFCVQGFLPLNPDDIEGMSWDLSLHTMISFLTNTNQQHYSGQAQLSYFSQMFGVTALQVITPMAGLAALAHALLARPEQVAAPRTTKWRSATFTLIWCAARPRSRRPIWGWP